MGRISAAPAPRPTRRAAGLPQAAARSAALWPEQDEQNDQADSQNGKKGFHRDLPQSARPRCQSAPAAVARSMERKGYGCGDR